MGRPPGSAGLLPGPDDIAAYREQGFWISPIILPYSVLDAAERGMARFYAGDRDAELPDVGGWTRRTARGCARTTTARSSCASWRTWSGTRR